MISLSFTLANPWSRRFENVLNRVYKTPIKHKVIELEVCKDTTIVSFHFRLGFRQSHGGMSMDLGLLGYSFSFEFYDTRHWNYEMNRYYIYDEEGYEH